MISKIEWIVCIKCLVLKYIEYLIKKAHFQTGLIFKHSSVKEIRGFLLRLAYYEIRLIFKILGYICVQDWSNASNSVLFKVSVYYSQSHIKIYSWKFMIREELYLSDKLSNFDSFGQSRNNLNWAVIRYIRKQILCFDKTGTVITRTWQVTPDTCVYFVNIRSV